MKNTLIILVLLAAGLQASAQTGMHIGFMAGGQYTMMLNNQPLDGVGKGFAYVPTFGRTGMFKVGYNFVPPIGIHVGIAYAEQGQDYTTVDGFGVETSVSRRATYLKVPILLHMTSTPGPVMFTMEIGPQFGLVKSASIEINGVPLTFPFRTAQLWKANDIEFAWSLGVEFAVSKTVRFTIQHRGDYGILDFENKNIVVNSNPFYPANRTNCNNLSFGLLGGMNFVVKGAHSKTTRHFKGRTWQNNWR